jgi:membrane-associated phospholipid phosphatase
VQPIPEVRVRHAPLVVLTFALAWRCPALAQATEPHTSVALSAAPAKVSLWRDAWPEFSTTEGVLTATAAIGTAVIVLAGPMKQPRWTGGILFDNAVRSGLRGSSPETRSRFRTVGNYTYHLSPVIPVFDVLVVSALGHGDARLTRNLALITLEAYSYVGISAFVSTELSARARPDAACQRHDCSADTQSFFSGHAAIAAASAGLVCANHSRIALYDAAWADAAVCGLSALNALTTATTRVVADRHYASDVLVGTSIGFGIGYAVPVLLHYSRGAQRIAIGPDSTCGSTCVGIGGTF